MVSTTSSPRFDALARVVGATSAVYLVPGAISGGLDGEPVGADWAIIDAVGVAGIGAVGIAGDSVDNAIDSIRGIS